VQSLALEKGAMVGTLPLFVPGMSVELLVDTFSIFRVQLFVSLNTSFIGSSRLFNLIDPFDGQTASPRLSRQVVDGTVDNSEMFRHPYLAAKSDSH